MNITTYIFEIKLLKMNCSFWELMLIVHHSNQLNPINPKIGFKYIPETIQTTPIVSRDSQQLFFDNFFGLLIYANFIPGAKWKPRPRSA